MSESRAPYAAGDGAPYRGGSDPNVMRISVPAGDETPLPAAGEPLHFEFEGTAYTSYVVEAWREGDDVCIRFGAVTKDPPSEA